MLQVQNVLTQRDEGEVHEHVDHGQPVHRRLLLQRVLWKALVVVAQHDVGDDVEVDPHVGVGEGEDGEQAQHQPASLVGPHSVVVTVLSLQHGGLERAMGFISWLWTKGRWVFFLGYGLKFFFSFLVME